AGAVPQTVDYLVRDVGRRHGHVTVRPAACVLVVPDDALRAELLVASTLRALHLVPVDGAVLASSSALDEVLDRLRAAGYLPLEETAGGVRVLSGRAGDGSSVVAGPSDAGSSDASPDVAAVGDGHAAAHG